MFEAIKRRRHFNFERLRDSAERDGLEVQRLKFERSMRPRVCFLVRGPRGVIIHESRTVTQAWEFYRGWLEGREYLHTPNVRGEGERG